MYKKNDEILKDFEFKEQIKSKKRVAANTLEIELEDGTKIYRFHSVDIITIKNDSVILNSGGYRTSTTKERLNQFNPLGLDIFQENYIWYIVHSWKREWNRDCTFYDGITFDKEGNLISENKPIDKKAWNKAKKKINDFVNLIDDLESIPVPNGGDCWYCSMVTQKSHKPLGDETGNHSHLITHIEEGYLHGSLILNALQETGYRDVFISMIFHDTYDFGTHRKDTIKRALRKYMIKRLLNTHYLENLLNIEVEV